MKKIKNKRLAMAAITAAIMLGTAGITIAVAPLTRIIKNAFSPADISIELLEPLYDSEHVTTLGDRMTVTVVPYQKIDKDPLIKNTSAKPEIVFMRVKVPIAEVRTVTSAKTALETNAYKEVYVLESDDASSVSASTELSGKDSATEDQVTNGTGDGRYWQGWEFGSGKIAINAAPVSQISHHPDWMLLSNKINYKNGKPISREYVFGCKRVLQPESLSFNGQTEKLFDKMTLVHFADQDAKGELNEAESRIDVFAYAIQADNVELDGSTKLEDKISGNVITTDAYDTLYTLYTLYGEEAAQAGG